MIKAIDLTKQFDGVTAVDRLTLDIESGEVFGFLGPNGAGKTTTVRMLTSLIAPSDGTAVVAGYPLGEADEEIRRHVGILTESPGLYERLTAERNLQIYGRLYEVEDVEGQVERYLRLLGLWERRKDPAGTFSKGMKQKLAIARALLHEPSVLFLDEPTVGLDPEAAKLVRDFVSELRTQGRTIFLCTHNLDEAERLCDRIAVFNQSLRVVDTPSGLRRQMYGRQVVFHLSDRPEPYVAMLKRLDFVREAEAIENKLLVSLDDPEVHNPELIRLLVETGAQIQFVGELRHSLEDVYLRLVHG
ncbi:MAG TPA: ABC transporter ATP-binding protein [Candidatus Binatia bacterium]|nr:ABC transporter ATP-binding protein [Candidatus Binatia bacterium]